MNKVVIFCLVLAVFHVGCIEAFNKIHIQNISYINLYSGRYTVGWKPVLQQQCVNDFAGLCRYYAPSFIQCQNVGSSGNNVVWKCSAQLSNGIAFNQLQVSCETWPGEHPASGWVVEGSCGLQYNLRRY